MDSHHWDHYTTQVDELGSIFKDDSQASSCSQTSSYTLTLSYEASHS